METVNVCESLKTLGVFPPKAITIPVLRGQFWVNYKSIVQLNTPSNDKKAEPIMFAVEVSAN